MIQRKELQNMVEDYKDITIGIFGSHSAEELGISAKSFGFKTVLICEKNRDRLYTKYSKNLYDHTIILDRFKDIITPETQN